jgi:poly(A) polymerase
MVAIGGGMSRREARQVARRLRDAGHRVVYAGGAVRDKLLGVRGGDVDIATSARPAEVEALFPRTVAVGAAFGVVKVLVGDSSYDVATFRRDLGASDGRHPDAIEPSTLEEDVTRRDFSINGLVEDPWSGEILDLVGGRNDLRDGLVRAIGDPALRFREDALRLLRGVRFAARFGFRIEAATHAAMRAGAQGLARISGERVRDELGRMLVHFSRRRAVELLDETGLLEVILPEIAALHGVEQPPEFHPEGDVWIHTLLALDGLPTRPSFELALGMLLHDVGKPPTFQVRDRIRFDGHDAVGADMVNDIARRLRLANRDRERIRELTAQHMRFRNAPDMRTSTLKRFLRQDHFPELLELHRIDCAASHGQLDLYDFCRDQLVRLEVAGEQDALRPAPLVTGNDLIEAGYTPGPLFGQILRWVEDEQLEGRLGDREEALRAVADHWGEPSGTVP